MPLTILQSFELLGRQRGIGESLWKGEERGSYHAVVQWWKGDVRGGEKGEVGLGSLQMEGNPAKGLLTAHFARNTWIPPLELFFADRSSSPIPFFLQPGRKLQSEMRRGEVFWEKSLHSITACLRIFPLWFPIVCGPLLNGPYLYAAEGLLFFLRGFHPIPRSGRYIWIPSLLTIVLWDSLTVNARLEKVREDTIRNIILVVRSENCSSLLQRDESVYHKHWKVAEESLALGRGSVLRSILCPSFFSFPWMKDNKFDDNEEKMQRLIQILSENVRFFSLLDFFTGRSITTDRLCLFEEFRAWELVMILLFTLLNPCTKDRMASLSLVLRISRG